MGNSLKHRWSIGNNYLGGITSGDWWSLLRENKFSVDWPYYHRAAFISLTSVMNSWYRRKERRLYQSEIERVEIEEPPLFILGHWRSGTTHLHNLLAQDTRQFAFPNTYQVVNPHTFLCTEEVNTRRFAFLVPKKRLMDNMALSFEAPQEDEIAQCLLTLQSLYLGMSFPRKEDYYARYLTFHDVSPEEIAEWKAGFTWFLKKLTLKYGRTLLLKSPPHTARIRMLLELFPDARFVHIHRNPFEVFQSHQHFFDTATWYTYLQRPDVEGIDERIIQRYRILYDAFFTDQPLIPDGQFHELSYEELERNPVHAIRTLYERLGLEGFDTMEPSLREYLDSISGYQKNAYPDLSPELRDRAAQEWKRSFEEWGYS